MASLNVDPLKLYFGGDYPINDDFVIHQPTVGQIMEYGESDFYQMLYVFVENTTMRRLQLWDAGISWTAMSDYELFCKLVQLLPVERTKILFGDRIDFTKFKLYGISRSEEEVKEFQKQYLDQDGKPKKLSKSQKRLKIFAEYEYNTLLYDAEDDIGINAATYHQLTDVLRAMFGISPKTEYANSKSMKQLIIDDERQKVQIEAKQHEGKVPTSTLLPLISACVNHPGFKYNIKQLKGLGVFAFMDSVKRLVLYENTSALLHGAYSGFCDTSKVPKEQFDFMREI